MKETVYLHILLIVIIELILIRLFLYQSVELAVNINNIEKGISIISIRLIFCAIEKSIFNKQQFKKYLVWNMCRMNRFIALR